MERWKDEKMKRWKDKIDREIERAEIETEAKVSSKKKKNISMHLVINWEKKLTKTFVKWEYLSEIMKLYTEKIYIRSFLHIRTNKKFSLWIIYFYLL